MPQDSDVPHRQLKATQQEQDKNRASSKAGETSSATDTVATQAENSPHEERYNPIVVGIGASAGGLEAYKRFFKHLPEDTGMCFVLIQHLDPTHKDLLAGYTPMPVVQIDTSMQAKENHVYIIPRNKYLSLKNRVLHLSAPVERRGMRMAIDFFFHSLAKDVQNKAIGIILSGMGSDGSQGVKAIKEVGGIVIAQQPGNTQYDSMPRSAIATNIVDHILNIEQMPKVLLNYVSHPYVSKSETLFNSDKKDEAENEFDTILNLLKTSSHYDFHYYKKGTLLRRIQRRMGLKQIQSLQEYRNYLEKYPDELTRLFQDILIGVTFFFRDTNAFDTLNQRIIHDLVEHVNVDGNIRVWVPGCSTGEEAYSIAMLLFDRLERVGKRANVQIFASDIDDQALETGRNARYPESISSHVPTEYLERFFSKEGNYYQVKKFLRDSVIFAVQSVIRDAPFSKLDLISCRNLLIYLEPKIQKKLIALFHFSLNQEGYLFLGGSESIGQEKSMFNTVSKKWRIYQRNAVMYSQRFEFPLLGDEHPTWTKGTQKESYHHSLRDITHGLLLEEYAPASVLIDKDYRVVYFFGKTSPYLEQPEGEPTNNILKMSRHSLRTKLWVVIHKAQRENNRVVLKNITPEDDEKKTHYNNNNHEPEKITQNYPERINLIAKPVSIPDSNRTYLLISFLPLHATFPQEEIHNESLDSTDALVNQLENELASMREELQGTIEELETSNEELKASNKEAMSMNEELQSANEELETSKEELQSVNEELNSVNSQLQDGLTELLNTNNDLNNLISSTDIATVFLDTQYRVKRFTPIATDIFKLIKSDEGRYLSDVACRLKNTDVLSDAKQVLEQLSPSSKEVHTQDNKWYIQRALPYRTQDNRIDGVVLTYANITQQKRLIHELLSVNNSLEQRVEDRAGYVRLLSQIAIIANQSQDFKVAFKRSIEEICDYLHWSLGHACLVNAQKYRFIENSNVWYFADHNHEPYQAFIKATEQLDLNSTQSLLGDVLNSKKARWLEDIRATHYIRVPILKQLNLCSALAFPVLAGDEVVAILECYSVQTLHSDDDLMEIATQIGIELGRVFERYQSRRLLEESEQRFRYMSNHAPAMICLFDATHQCHWLNRSMRDFLGDEVSSDFAKVWHKALHPNDQEDFINYLQEAFAQKTTFEREWRLKRCDGEYRWLLGKGAPRFTENSGERTLLGYIISSIDVTEHKEAEENAKKHLSQLAHLGRVSVAGELASGLAHEINQPLSAITNYAKGLQHLLAQNASVPHERLVKAAGLIQEQALRAGDIIRHLRDFMRFKEPKKVETDINALLQDIKELWTPEARLADIEFTVEEEPWLPLVMADGIQIQQVLLNLLRNALEAMQNYERAKTEPRLKRKELHICTHSIAEGDVEIQIIDTGPGMDDAVLQKLFHPFFTTKEDGMGLGLSISRTIIESHDGRLSAEKNPDGGMTFKILLPGMKLYGNES